MKVSKRKIFKLSLAVLLLLVMCWATGRFHDTRCDEIVISIDSTEDVHFVEENDVLRLIYNVVDKIEGYKMDSIDIYKIDGVLKKHPFIRSASIYKTISGKLKIDIVQRKPLLMVINNTGQSYYIDNDGIIFETSKKSSPQVIVANGFIKDKFDFSDGKVYKIDLSDDKTPGTQSDLFKLIKLIDGDDFWRDQIEQIYVNSLSEYELVPMLGRHILSIGSIEDYDKKMYILKEFYFRGLKKAGWNAYKQISVKYKNQIVCKRFKNRKQ